jgi:glycine hydroxymethyltransferase
VNKNAIPDDPESPFVTSGIRIGSPALTTRGFGQDEASETANLIADVLDHPEDTTVISRTKDAIKSLCKRYPVYG